ncbi:glycoside hydrolase family 3 N-terminal domain-containing protein [Microbacterium invictum]|uniref:Glycoside hydrolase family 3 N-terminal domain-containing protein n=1 Tax=Microbacterium invictum TaxID=515415 RepID=A0ABZ0VAW3_9MICO|nr:glycoside hydrolase family 3 N-terminal domain-containing protein [Microbacterium invictum]WQB70766.1 glycoside hydrolase family 3 N-terminal domain-containing protein [Microbacterium invictum]
MTDVTDVADRASSGAGRPRWADPSLDPSTRVEMLLAAMTDEEKIAQLGGYWADTRDSTQLIAPMQDVLSRGRPPFDEAVRDGIGHLTRVFGVTPVAARDGMQKVQDAQRHLRENTRLGIPAVVHEECLTGFTTYGATVYPASMAWAATFDADLVREMAAAIGADMRAVGAHHGLSPVLDVVTDYRWGRVEETLGEDPYVVGTLATAYVHGLQHSGIIATLKHFAGHATSRGGRNHAPVSLGERELRDLVLPPFEMAVRIGGAASVMNSYTELDRVPAAADRWLLTDLLRDEWGFSGTVVSDYWAVAFLKSKHQVAETMADAGRLALHAGIDVELPDIAAYRLLHDDDPDPVRTAYDIDTAVRRVLHQKLELGLLDAGWTPPEPADVDLDSPRNRDIARRLAEESIILLDNSRGVLPLATSVRRIAVVGPIADDPRAMMGAYSYPIHVMPRHPEMGLGVDVVTFPEALRIAFPGAELRVEHGVPLADPADDAAIARAVEAAASSDVVIAVVGDRAGMFGRGTSGEGSDAPDLGLPGEQGRLVEAVLATGTPVVLVVMSGRPYALGDYIDRAAAIVQAFMPGIEGAAALAAVLSGTVNPSGHLPVQVPRTGAALPHTYLAPPLGQDGDRISNLSIAPAFPFGHGLSYTSFTLGDVRLDSERIAADGRVCASVEVRNAGERAGATVVQLYASDPVAQVTRPVRQLVGYARVHLAPGEGAIVRFDVHADRFSFTGLDRRRIVEPGRIDLVAGLSLTDTSGIATLTVDGPGRVVDEPVLVTPVDLIPITPEPTEGDAG